MVPSVIVMLAIVGVLFGMVSSFLTLTIGTTPCNGTCEPDVRRTLVAAFPYVACGLFAVAAAGSLLLRNRRWWFAVPPLIALPLIVIAAWIMIQASG